MQFFKNIIEAIYIHMLKNCIFTCFTWIILQLPP